MESHYANPTLSLTSRIVSVAMISRLALRTPIFERTARDGHVGHADLPWEEEPDQETGKA